MAWDLHVAHRFSPATSKMLLVLLFMMYFPIATQSSLKFGCISPSFGESDADSGALNKLPSFLEDAPWIRCGSPEQEHMALVAGLVLSLVLAAVAGLGLLLKIKHASSSSSLSPTLIVHAAEFLLEPYKAHVWWYEAVVVVRRLAFALLITSLPSTSSFRVPLLSALLLTALLLHMILSPYRALAANRMEVLALVASLLSLHMADAMTTTADPRSLTAFSISFIVLNALVVGVYIVGLAVPLVAAFRAFRSPSM